MKSIVTAAMFVTAGLLGQADVFGWGGNCLCGKNPAKLVIHTKDTPTNVKPASKVSTYMPNEDCVSCGQTNEVCVMTINAFEKCKQPITVKAPADFPIEVDSVSAPLKISKTRGPLTVRSETGSVALDKISGPAIITTNSGAITGTVGGSAELTTQSGDIFLTCGKIKETTVTFKSGTGAVNITVPKKTKVSSALTTKTGMISNAFVQSATPDLTVIGQTTSGSINILGK